MSVDNQFHQQLGLLTRVKRWLIIITLVLIAFSVIVLGLGYVLHKNKQQEELYQQQQFELRQQQKQQQLATQQQATQASIQRQNRQKATQHLQNQLAELESLERKKTIIVEHITCATDEQCQLFDTGRIELGCVVAVNQIGQHMLNQTAFLTPSGECEEQVSQLKASCRHNICMVE